jgi:hypothetical protein
VIAKSNRWLYAKIRPLLTGRSDRSRSRRRKQARLSGKEFFGG